MVSGIYFCGHLLTILFASEDSHSLMGGSDVVHCVRAPLTGTTMAAFSTYGSVVGIVLYVYIHFVHYSGEWGPL